MRVRTGRRLSTVAVSSIALLFILAVTPVATWSRRHDAVLGVLYLVALVGFSAAFVAWVMSLVHHFRTQHRWHDQTGWLLALIILNFPASWVYWYMQAEQSEEEAG